MIAENNGKITKQIGGCTGSGFLPGHSGNPGGRPKNQLAEIIRRETQDGKELVNKMLELLRTTKNEELKIKIITWLSDRAWGKPIQESYEQSESAKLPLSYLLEILTTEYRDQVFIK